MAVGEHRECNGARRHRRRRLPVAHPSPLRPPRARLSLPSLRHPPPWGRPLAAAGLLRQWGGGGGPASQAAASPAWPVHGDSVSPSAPSPCHCRSAALMARCPRPLGASLPSGGSPYPENHLSGEIPREIAGCRRLQILNLSRNALSGQVPLEISTLSGLRALDISDNKISLRNLERLSLGGNLFTGRIPTVLSSLRRLRFLHLAGNPGLLKLPGAEEASSSGELLPMRHLLAENSTGDDDRAAAAVPGPSPSPSASPPAKITRWQFVWEYILHPLVMSILVAIFASIFWCLIGSWYGKRNDQEDHETELREEQSVQQEGRPAEEQ